MIFLTKKNSTSHMKLDEEEIQLCAVVARQIWLRRNVVIHGGILEHPKMVVQHAREQINSFELAMVARQQNGVSLEVAESRWIKPPEGWVKLNWDASLDGKRLRWALAWWLETIWGRLWLFYVTHDHISLNRKGPNC
jgi:hypothetical protein